MKNTKLIASCCILVVSFCLWQCSNTLKSPNTDILLSEPLNTTSGLGSSDLPFPFLSIRPSYPRDFLNSEVTPQGIANNFSWNDFIAICWPTSTDSTKRGIPDLSNVIGGLAIPGFGNNKADAGPVVWETFKPTNDVFLKPYAVPNPSFDAAPAASEKCKDGRVISQKAKVSETVSDVTQAKSHKPLFDQNGNYVMYEILYNRSAFDYVIKNELYNSKNQNNIDFPMGSPETEEVGAMRVKAAWMKFNWDEPWKKKYFYTSLGQVIDPVTEICDTATLALVGLHIVHKIESKKQWVWSTFEHMYNCPDASGWPELPQDWKKYSFFDPSKPGPYNAKPNSVAIINQTPVQVQRVTPIPKETKVINKAYQNLMRSYSDDNVWQYYMLVDTQWPNKEVGETVNYKPTPDKLANTVMETYIQETSTCMGCHSGGKDFGFQLYSAQTPKTGGHFPATPQPKLFSSKKDIQIEEQLPTTEINSIDNYISTNTKK